MRRITYKKAAAVAMAAAMSAALLVGCGSTAASLSLIHISEPTRPY